MSTLADFLHLTLDEKIAALQKIGFETRRFTFTSSDNFRTYGVLMPFKAGKPHEKCADAMDFYYKSLSFEFTKFEIQKDDMTQWVDHVFIFELSKRLVNLFQ